MAPPLVLLHGFTQTGESWRPVIDQLGERYRAVAPDLRGHGSAGDRRPVDLGACVEDVAALVADEPFALAGYSMGGRVALHVALAHPDRVERLVLVSASPGIADDVERDARREADEELAAELEGQEDVAAFASRWGRQRLFTGQSPAVRELLHADRLRSGPAGLAAALRGLGPGSMEPLWGRLGELAMPVTLVVGERDAKYVAIAERMAARVPRARVVSVPAVGHAAHVEAPAIVAELL